YLDHNAYDNYGDGDENIMRDDPLTAADVNTTGWTWEWCLVIVSVLVGGTSVGAGIVATSRFLRRMNEMRDPDRFTATCKVIRNSWNAYRGQGRTRLQAMGDLIRQGRKFLQRRANRRRQHRQEQQQQQQQRREEQRRRDGVMSSEDIEAATDAAYADGRM